MMKDIDLIGRIIDAAKDAYNLKLFGGDDKLEELCNEYLLKVGYITQKPKYRSKKQINSVDDLINHFYSLCNIKFGISMSEQTNFFRNDINLDRRVANLFIKSRMEASKIDKQTAIKECVDIVETVIENFEDFKFKWAISFSIFGQSKLSWVTEKAVMIINKRGNYVDELMCDEITKRIDTEESRGYGDLSAVLEDLIKNKEE